MPILHSLFFMHNDKPQGRGASPRPAGGAGSTSYFRYITFVMIISTIAIAVIAMKIERRRKSDSMIVLGIDFPNSVLADNLYIILLSRSISKQSPPPIINNVLSDNNSARCFVESVINR